jgi:S1-C subfamily serine protease
LISLRIPFLAATSIAISTAMPVRGDDFIDDAAVKANFESRLTQLYKQGGLPTGLTTTEQLRAASRAGINPLPPAPLVDPTSTSPDDAPAFPSLFARAKAATLVLGHLYLCGKCEKYHANLAGGVLLSSDGFALTNYHVLDFREAIVFGAMTSTGQVYAIDQVLAASKADDIALVRLRGANGLPHLNLQPQVETGDEVFVVSHPDGHFYTLTRGYVARRYLTAKERIPRLQITADFAKGSSGSGIFNQRGDLVGLVTSTNSIYYNETEGKKDNLQMVVKSGVPVESILKLFRTTP